VVYSLSIFSHRKSDYPSMRDSLLLFFVHTFKEISKKIILDVKLFTFAKKIQNVFNGLTKLICWAYHQGIIQKWLDLKMNYCILCFYNNQEVIHETFCLQQHYKIKQFPTNFEMESSHETVFKYICCWKWGILQKRLTIFCFRMNV